jgi:hypothetical protein
MTAPNPTPTREPPDGQPARPTLGYRGRRLDGPTPEFHAAVDALAADTVPETYYQRVLASRERPANQR